MKASAIYLMAAEKVAAGDEDFACLAVVAPFYNGEEGRGYVLDRFTSLFCPREVKSYSPFFGHYADPENRQARVLALLFAREIALDEEGRK